MNFPQNTAYGYAPSHGLPGDIVDTIPHVIRTKKAGGTIPFGVAVVLDATDEDLVIVPPTPAADDNSIIDTGVTTAGIQTYLPDGGAGLIFDGVIGGQAFPYYAYLLELTENAHADWDATTAVVEGLDVCGAPVRATITTIANAGGVANQNEWVGIAQPTRFVLPAQTGTNGTFDLGNQAGITQVRAFGIAIRNQALQATQYVDGDEVLVLVMGTIWVRPTGVASGSVYARQTATVRATAGAGERQGELSNVVDGGDNGYWPRARFLEDAAVYHATTNPNACVPLEVTL